MSTRTPLAGARALVLLGFLTVAAGAAITLSAQQVPPVGALLSLNVSPSATSRSVGQQAFFKVDGLFEGGTRILGGNGSALWSFILSPSMAVAMCATPPNNPMFGGQVISVQANGTFQETWSPMTPVVKATGLLTSATVHVDLACADPNINPITGSMDLSWSGTQYDGHYTFANNGAAELAGLTWTSSNPAVATADQRGKATAVSPGTTTITATYGRTCWPGEPQPAGGCRGTVSGSAVLTVNAAPCPPPTITGVALSQTELWPPNHKMVNVTVTPSVQNSCSQPVSCKIASITSNEASDGFGDGDTSPDWEGPSPLTARLRAERSGTGDGRVYTIVTECTNSSGMATRASIVTVPH